MKLQHPPATRETLVDLIHRLPDDLLEEAASVLDEMITIHARGYYDATPEELEAIDRGLAEADRGEFVDPESVREELAKFRR